ALFVYGLLLPTIRNGGRRDALSVANVSALYLRGHVGVAASDADGAGSNSDRSAVDACRSSNCCANAGDHAVCRGSAIPKAGAGLGDERTGASRAERQRSDRAPELPSASRLRSRVEARG